MSWSRILPPTEDRIVAWRWTIAVLVLLLTVNGLSARGLIGIGAFAYASDTDRILTLQLGTALRDLQSELCRSNGNKRLLDRVIEEYQQEYIAINGDRYPLTHCDNDNKRN